MIIHHFQHVFQPRNLHIQFVKSFVGLKEIDPKQDKHA